MSPPTVRQQPQPAQQSSGFRMSTENLLSDQSMPPPLPPLKPEWRHHINTAQGLRSDDMEDGDDEDEEAIPNDSLYGTQETVVQAGSYRERGQYGSRPALSDMAHWSSHGYLARDDAQDTTRDSRDSRGYVVLKRQGDTMVTMRSPSSGQPSSLPPVTTSTLPHNINNNNNTGDNKYFSVRGYKDFTNKVNERLGPVNTDAVEQKYFSVDAKFLHHQAAADMKTKLREGLKVSNTQQQIYGTNNNNSNNNKPELPQYYQPPPPPQYPPYQRPPPPQRQHSDLSRPAPPQRQHSDLSRPVPLQRQHSDLSKPSVHPKPTIKNPGSNLESSKAMSGSVSWLEWTQQLQAYIAWVNSQLRKRPGLTPVQDLRTDLQSGEVLAQLIEIICKYQILAECSVFLVSL